MFPFSNNGEFFGKEECSASAKTTKIDADRFSFITQWFKKEADLWLKYILNYYPLDESIELIDMNNVNHRRFLKKTKVDNVRVEDLFIGNTLNIYSRQMKIIDYGDLFTRNYFAPKTEKAFLLVKPEAVQYLGCIIVEIEKVFKICKAKMANVDSFTAGKLYEDRSQEENYEKITENLTVSPAVAFLLIADNANDKLQSLIGDENPIKAKNNSPSSLRSLYGKDTISNGFYASNSVEKALKDSSLFFPKTKEQSGAVASVSQNDSTLNYSTCLIIKPHIVKQNMAGQIISDIISAGFQIMAFESFYLNQNQAEHFYQVYNGVVAEFPSMAAELSSGECYCLEISGFGGETPEKVRCFVGPSNPDIARKLRPNSLRAKYGVDKIRNAVHVTDLVQDTKIELEFFFKYLTRENC